MPGKNTEKKAVITEMEEVENKILPNQNSRTFIFRKNRDGNGLHITLRLGRPGINYAVQYFTLNSPSLCGSNHHHLSCRTLPRQINTLFRELRNSYEHETPRTKEFIHAFLTELKSAYNPRLFPANFSKQTTQDNLAFSRRRMAAIVQDFNRSLH